MEFKKHKVEEGHPWTDKYGTDMDKAKSLLASNVTGKKISETTGINKVSIYNYRAGKTSIEKSAWNVVNKLARMWETEYIIYHLKGVENQFIAFVARYREQFNEIIKNQIDIANSEEGIKDDKAFVKVIEVMVDNVNSNIFEMFELFDVYRKRGK